MLDGKPSATALAVAALRALHQEIDRPLVFEDRLAGRIIDGMGGDPLGRWRADAARWSRLRASVAARSRIAEDRLAEDAARGARQYVLLGAGLDTFGCRGAPAWPDLLVFEVDHPATQAWKRQHLAGSGLTPPAALHFVPHDFERQDLLLSLGQAGFRFDRPAVFALLGVAIYIERAALLQTIALVGSMGAGMATLVFDYAEPPEKAPPAIRAAYAAVGSRAAEAGEPWRSFFRPAELARALEERGFVSVIDEDSTAMKARLFADRADGLAPGPLSHVVTART